MTFEEFLEKCREKDGWRVNEIGCIRNALRHCPMQSIFGVVGYLDAAEAAGLDARQIMWSADGKRSKHPYRKALLGLVKP